jgi:hypothetical protein
MNTIILLLAGLLVSA